MFLVGSRYENCTLILVCCRAVICKYRATTATTTTTTTTTTTASNNNICTYVHKYNIQYLCEYTPTFLLATMIATNFSLNTICLIIMSRGSSFDYNSLRCIFNTIKTLLECVCACVRTPIISSIASLQRDYLIYIS